MARDYRTLKLEILAETKKFVDDMKNGEKQVESFGDKATKMGKVAAAAFAAAAAAAAAYAGKLLVEGVKAAIEDAAAQERLANSLRNVTKATDDQIASVEKQITQMSLAFGVADDQLRPAFQRLATATGSLTTANDSLRLALDISAATGKSVEQVSNALAKAYEGNAGALGRLGIGLSTAEIKSLGLKGTMDQLALTFGGAATTQANTLEGQIARLQVAFDEAKESVGARLLPAITSLLNYFINTVIPKFTEFKDKALEPVTTAINNNREAFNTLWKFIKNFLVPIIVDGLGSALSFIGKVAGGILTIIGNVVTGIKKAVDFTIDGINAVIRQYNRIPILPDIPEIKKPNFVAPNITSNQGGSQGGRLPGSPPPVNPPKSFSTPQTPSKVPSGPPQEISTGFIPMTALADGANTLLNPNITVVVQAPTVIDEEGFQRSVVNALNQATNRGTGGGGALSRQAAIL